MAHLPNSIFMQRDTFIISGKVKRARWGNDRVQTNRNKTKWSVICISAALWCIKPVVMKQVVLCQVCEQIHVSESPFGNERFLLSLHTKMNLLYGQHKKERKMTKYYFIRLVSEIILEKIIFSREKKHKFCHLGARNSNSSSIPDCFLFFVLPTSSREQSLTWKSWKCRSMLQDIKCYHCGVS